jgi:hypothetical protein
MVLTNSVSWVKHSCSSFSVSNSTWVKLLAVSLWVGQLLGHQLHDFDLLFLLHLLLSIRLLEYQPFIKGKKKSMTCFEPNFQLIFF